MCLAIPGKIESIDETNSPRMGKVNFGGIYKSICLELLPEAKLHDYVLVHVGFAISIVDEEEAMETLKNLQQMDEIRKEFGDEP